VGNFGNGKINAFNISSGAFLGSLLHRKDQPLEFNGLWALFFFHKHLYFTAGIADESHGLFGLIRAEGEQEEEGDNAERTERLKRSRSNTPNGAANCTGCFPERERGPGSQAV
jgi:hypothetical protein